MVKTYRDLVNDAKAQITEVEPAALHTELHGGEEIILIDVREHTDYRDGHLSGAVPLARGMLEVRISDAVPDHEAQIVVYCGGGGRGALSALTLQSMGYVNVRNLAGGYRGWTAAGQDTTTSDA